MWRGPTNLAKKTFVARCLISYLFPGSEAALNLFTWTSKYLPSFSLCSFTTSSSPLSRRTKSWFYIGFVIDRAKILSYSVWALLFCRKLNLSSFHPNVWALSYRFYLFLQKPPECDWSTVGYFCFRTVHLYISWWIICSSAISMSLP